MTRDDFNQIIKNKDQFIKENEPEKLEQVFFYKMMLTDAQHAQLLNIIVSYRHKCSHQELCKEKLENIALAVVCATKEERE